MYSDISKKMLKICLLFIIVLVTLNFGAEVNAVEYSGYNANEWSIFKNRTKEQIGHEYAKAYYTGPTYNNTDKTSYYTRQPSLEAPYDGGCLTEDTLKVVEAQINYFRFLAGVNPLKNAVTTSEQMQIGALARNMYFDHDISQKEKPEGMSDEMWKLAVYCSHNVLASSYSPRESIKGWLDEGYSKYQKKFDTIGHRMAIINQKVSDFNYGYSGKVAIGGAKWQNTAEIPYVAFPSPGYMPIDILSPKASAWNIEINRNIIQTPSDFNTVKVKVTNINSGDCYECTNANGNLKLQTAGEYTIYFVQPDATSYKYAEGDKFKVEVEGFTEKSTGKAITLTYTTEFFDVTKHVDSARLKTASVSGIWRKVNIAPNLENEDTLNKISKLFPNTIEINTDIGKKDTLTFSGDWILDMDNKCWYKNINKNEIPSYLIDPDGKLNTIKIQYTTDTTLNNCNFIIETEPQIGEKGKIQINKMYKSFGNTSKICEIYQVDNNSKVKLKYNNKIAYNEYSVEFETDPYKLSDTGTYIAVYYSDTASYQSNYGVCIAGVADVDVNEYERVDVDENSKYIFKDLNKIIKLQPKFSETATNYTYKSTNEKIIKVDDNGKVTPIKPGFANIEIEDKTNNKKVIMKFYVQVLVVLSNGSKAYVGDMDRNGIFDASDSSLILEAYKRNPTADETLVGDVDGNEVLDASDASMILELFKSEEFKPGEYKPIEEIKLDNTEVSILVNTEKTIKEIITAPENTTDSLKVEWTSSNEKVAKVDENGKIQALSRGIATITAKTTNNMTATCKIKVLKDENDEVLDYEIGDINGDDGITAKDLNILYSYIKGTKDLSKEELERADVTGDGEVTAKDLNRLYAHLNGTKPL